MMAIVAATGTYLQFMDSDDWLTPDATERLVTLAEMTGPIWSSGIFTGWTAITMR